MTIDKTKKNNTYYEAPFLEEISSYTQNTRRNLLAFSTLVYMYSFGLIDTKFTGSGIIFSALNNWQTKLFLILFLLYFFVHFLLLAFNHLFEWRAKLSGDVKNFGRYENFEDLGGRDKAKKVNQSTLFSIFLAHKHYVEECNKKLDVLKIKIENGVGAIDAASGLGINSLKPNLNPELQPIEQQMNLSRAQQQISNTINRAFQEKFPFDSEYINKIENLRSCCEKFECYMVFLRQYQNYSFLIFELVIPLAYSFVAGCFLVGSL